MKKILLLLACLSLSSFNVFAQSNTINVPVSLNVASPSNTQVVASNGTDTLNVGSNTSFTLNPNQSFNSIHISTTTSNNNNKIVMNVQ